MQRAKQKTKKQKTKKQETGQTPKRKPEMGKYLLYQFFRRNATIRKYLPATRRLTEKSFREFVNKYGMVYVKPSGGSRGVNVLKVWKESEQVHVKHTTRSKRTFQNVDAAFRHITRLRNGKAYIIQQGIRLAKVKGRPFDIRVMMQRSKPGGEWLYSGMVAKVAGPSSVVTNVALSKGYVITVQQALKQSLGWKSKRIEQMVEELKRVGRIGARHFDNYQGYRELGFDMAVDVNGKLWMIEQNTAPSHPLFKKLKGDLSMFRRIEYRYGRYARALRGRTGKKSGGRSGQVSARKKTRVTQSSKK